VFQGQDGSSSDNYAGEEDDAQKEYPVVSKQMTSNQMTIGDEENLPRVKWTLRSDPDSVDANLIAFGEEEGEEAQEVADGEGFVDGAQGDGEGFMAREKAFMDETTGDEAGEGFVSDAPGEEFMDFERDARGIEAKKGRARQVFDMIAQAEKRRLRNLSPPRNTLTSVNAPSNANGYEDSDVQKRVFGDNVSGLGFGDFLLYKRHARDMRENLRHQIRQLQELTKRRKEITVQQRDQKSHKHERD
jgi:hypothetical protein